ncbi:HAD family hydrolase [Persephonella sp.]
MELASVLMNYRLIVWDFDGTIVKLNVDWNKVKEEILKNYSGLLNGKKISSINEVIYEIRKYTSDKEVFNIIEKYESASGYKPNQKIINIIKMLKRNRKTQAILSDNMSSTVKRILREISIYDCFDQIMCKDSVNRYKPDPEGIGKIFKQYNISKSEVVMIGDSWKDKELCNRFGIVFMDVEGLASHG